ncbi:hypothetical protein BDR22DRAFT_894756 [Usnea florida]
MIQAGIRLTTATTCYKYSGQIGDTGTDASGDVPCDPYAQVSACCGAGSICISNLYCYDANITTPSVPGTCTDQSFADPACPCPPTTSLVYTDDVTFCSDGSYCCGNNNTACCSSNNGNLEIFYGNPGTIPSATSSLPGYYSSLHLSTKSRSTTISSSSSTQASTTTSTLTSFPTSEAQTSFTSTVSSPATTTPTISTPIAFPTSRSHSRAGSGTLNKNSKIIIGTVVPMAILSIGFIAWFLRKRQRSFVATSLHDETVENATANMHAPEPHPPG